MDHSAGRIKNKISQKNYFRKCYSMSKELFEQLKQLTGEAHMICWETLYHPARVGRTTQDYWWEQLEIFWLNFELEMYIQMERGNIFEFNHEIVNRVTYSEHIFMSETTPKHFVLGVYTPVHNHKLSLCSQTADITAADYCKAWLEEISDDFLPLWSMISPHSPHRLEGHELEIALGKLERDKSACLQKLAPVIDLIKKTGVLVII